MKYTFLETADRIGARLCRDALWDGSRCNWVAGYDAGNGTPLYRALGPAVYDGTSGIALFLSRLFQATGGRIFAITAAAALRQALSRCEAIPPAASVGFYSGLAGIGYVASVAGETLGNDSFIAQALRMARGWTADSFESRALDVIGGSAGAIPALLHLHRRRRGDFFLDLAVRHGDRLLNAANKGDFGWSWTTLEGAPGKSRPDLTGFAHGAAGICWALLELFHATREDRFRQGAKEGFRYERHWFNPELENWPDFRCHGDENSDRGETWEYATAWCHGAPGIGFSRLRAWQILEDPSYRAEAEAALRTTAKTLSQADPGNYSLCHGRAGNAELLLYASEVLKNLDCQPAALRVAYEGIEQYEKEKVPWPCGGLPESETPDLMLGLAGIGHFYLHVHDPLVSRPVLILLPE